MIHVSSVNTLYGLMAELLFFGVTKRYSYQAIEERIGASSLMEELEEGRDDFLYDRFLDDFIAEIYPNEEGNPLNNQETNALFLWMGEAYIRLFFHFHKTIGYIFLYLPIEEMMGSFALYHELDWGQLFTHFESKTKEITLLRKLLKKKGLTKNKLAQKTGIDSAAIDYYCRADKNLFKGGFSNIYFIAVALKEDPKLFLKEIFNYTYGGSFEFDRSNIMYRSYLGLYYCSYFDGVIGARKYRYRSDLGCFDSPEGQLWVRRVDVGDSERAIEAIDGIVSEMAIQIPRALRHTTVLAIFEFGEISDSTKSFSRLLEYGFGKIFIINEAAVVCVSESGKWISYITESVNDSLVTRAKKAGDGDFAL